MEISSRLDGGNIRSLAVERTAAALEILPDPGTSFLHWFHFQCTAAEPGEHRFRIVNAGRSRTPDGWRDYRALASYDRRHWFRLPTTFDGETLSFALAPRHPLVFFAHFAPYTQERLLDLLARCQAHPEVRLAVAGLSLEGRPIHRLRLGQPDGAKPVVWVTAGQHPGEPMGPWCAEGLLDRLLDPDDGVAARLRREAVFHVIPTLNPDGSVAGRLRTNAAGTDLNRAWADPRPATAPEVLAVRSLMERTGADLFIDLHGDETIPHAFVVPSDSVPSATPRLVALRRAFEARLASADPDLRLEPGYPPEAPGTADLGIAANWVEDRFGCLAVTLEQPFKDPGGQPPTEAGWSPGRCRRLGGALLDAVAALLPRLRERG